MRRGGVRSILRQGGRKKNQKGGKKEGAGDKITGAPRTPRGVAAPLALIAGQHHQEELGEEKKEAGERIRSGSAGRLSR